MKLFFGVLAAVGVTAHGAVGQGIAHVAVNGLQSPAVADAQARVVYFNPFQLRALGGDLALFIVAHEEAHLLLGHHLPKDEADSLRLRAMEEEADCAAAARLSTVRGWNRHAVTRVFDLIGDVRLDGEWRTGAERAASIRACALGQATVRLASGG